MASVNPVEIRYQGRQREWRWPIAVYLYLAGMGSGAFAVGTVLDWLGRASSLPGAVLLWGPIMVAIGAPFLILDLGTKRRFLNAGLNPKTSWVARGFLILSSFIIVGVITFGLSLLSALGIVGDRSILFLVLEGVGFVLALATAIYTGVLLQSVRFVSLWNTSMLPALFLASALSTGSMAIILSAVGYGLIVPEQGFPSQLMEIMTPTEQVLILIEAVLLILFLGLRYRAEKEMESSVRLLVSGRMRLLFWAGIVASGFFFPVVFELVYSRFHDVPLWLFLAAFFLLMGGFFLRFGIVSAGIKQSNPLHRMLEVRYALRGVRKTGV